VRLLLFDIDGTLLRCGPQVRRIFATALGEVFGTTGPIDGYDFSGKTDRQIVVDLISATGVDTTTVRRRLPEMRDCYLERLDRELSAAEMKVTPEAERILVELDRRDDVVVGLLTGNWRGGAFTKLGRLGLDRFFGFGAFADDGDDRPELLPVAWRRARKSAGYDFSARQTLIIGDSVHDIRCGSEHGVPVLAVTTGWTTAERLEEAGASWVSKNLSEGLVVAGVRA